MGRPVPKPPGVVGALWHRLAQVLDELVHTCELLALGVVLFWHSHSVSGGLSVYNPRYIHVAQQPFPEISFPLLTVFVSCSKT